MRSYAIGTHYRAGRILECCPSHKLLHVLQAFGGDGFGAGVEDEDFDGDVTGVVDVFKGFEDGGELHVAEAWAFEVGVVGVVVGEVLGVFADGGGPAGGFVGHGLGVEQ